jgi:hypothetical protein
MDKILHKILNKVNKDDLLNSITHDVTGSEFNSLMLEIFRNRVNQLQPAQLLKEYTQNRFVKPSSMDAIKSREEELTWLRLAQAHGFEPVIISPVSPLGTCTVVGPVNQNKVLSSTKGTEVVADATNVLALKIAEEFKGITDREKCVSYATIHRVIRAQHFDNPHFSAHFSLFCMVSSGFDAGNHDFELDQINKHIALYLKMLQKHFSRDTMVLKFYLKSKNEKFSKLLHDSKHIWHSMKYEFIDDFSNAYYQTVQFKIFVTIDNMQLDIVDGGIVNWVQKLTGNQKLRTVISAVGLELLEHLTEG